MGGDALIRVIAGMLPEARDAALRIALEPCGGGGNNRVFSFVCGGRRLIAKCYFSHPSDHRDRLGAEYAFLGYAHAAGIQCVPRPIACDTQHHVALYEHLPGHRIEPRDVGEKLVEQAIAFFVALNSPEHRARAAALPIASEGGFSVADHFAVVDRRVARLQSIPSRATIDGEAARFVSGLARQWARIKDSICADLARAGEPVEAPVAQWCVSPSDFGFHNALVDDAGRVRFIDFEYAGRDDPAKMAGDFFCQPAVPVPMRCYDHFLAAAMAYSPRAPVLIARARLLLPVFQLKWCCIMLNDFLPDDARRRRFADPTIDGEQRKALQLGKAQHLMNHIAR